MSIERLSSSVRGTALLLSSSGAIPYIDGASKQARKQAFIMEVGRSRIGILFAASKEASLLFFCFVFSILFPFLFVSIMMMICFLDCLGRQAAWLWLAYHTGLDTAFDSTAYIVCMEGALYRDMEKSVTAREIKE